MFSTITKNPDPRVGKIFGPMSYVGKSTTFDSGRPDWQADYKSHMDRSYSVSKIYNLKTITLQSVHSNNFLLLFVELRAIRTQKRL